MAQVLLMICYYIAGGANGNSIYAYVDSHGAANGGFNIYEVYGNAGESDLLFTTTNGAVKLLIQIVLN